MITIEPPASSSSHRRRQPSTEAFHRAISRRSITYEMLAKQRGDKRETADDCCPNLTLVPPADGAQTRNNTEVAAHHSSPRGRATSFHRDDDSNASLDSHDALKTIQVYRNRCSVNGSRIMNATAVDLNCSSPKLRNNNDEDWLNPDTVRDDPHALASSASPDYLFSHRLDFLRVEAPPLKSYEVQHANSSLRAFAVLAGEDLIGSRKERTFGAPRYFFGRQIIRGQEKVVKLKLVNVGPDTHKLSLVGYANRLIKLIKHRRTRLSEIERGLCIFKHENLIIIKHDLKVYERALKAALRMLKDSKLLATKSHEAQMIPIQVAPWSSSTKNALMMGPGTAGTAGTRVSQNALAARIVRPVSKQALLRPAVNFAYTETYNDFVDGISVSGVSDLLSMNSEGTSELKEEVEELRQSLKKVREDIAYILQEEDDENSASSSGGEVRPPMDHINAIRRCSIHSLGSSAL